MQVTLPITIIIAIIGACFGSFITAASWRLPRGEDAVTGASKCPKCGTKLKFLDLFPILSWVFSGGKCRYCKTGISARYIVTEIITALIFTGLLLAYGLSWKFGILALLAVALLILIISDFETYIIPDSTTVTALVLAIIYHYLYSPAYFDYILGFIICLIVAVALKYGFLLITRRDGLGMADVKFLPVAGLWIGLSSVPVYLVMSGVIGVVTGVIWKRVFKNPEFPFGPALAISMYILIIFPQIGQIGLLLLPK